MSFLRPYVEVAQNAKRIIKQNGGIMSSLKVFWLTDDLKDGTLKGTDKFGNKYYENDRYFYARNRWVRYSEKQHLEYDPSQIPAEWHRWLHYMTDDTPVDKPPTMRKWMIDHQENMTGTKECYVPYSTTGPKIESWKPPC